MNKKGHSPLFGGVGPKEIFWQNFLMVRISRSQFGDDQRSVSPSQTVRISGEAPLLSNWIKFFNLFSFLEELFVLLTRQKRFGLKLFDYSSLMNRNIRAAYLNSLGFQEAGIQYSLDQLLAENVIGNFV
jgi:hypothetical protein